MRAVRVVTLSLAMVLAFGAACSSADETEASAAGAESAPAVTGAAFTRLDPDAFAERMKNRGAAVINVHIPYEGEINGTDAFIPYDQVIGDHRLPEDKTQEILLYCRSGSMSEETGAELIKVGYTKVAHLEGGMKAWQAAGRRLVHNPANAPKTPVKDLMQHS